MCFEIVDGCNWVVGCVIIFLRLGDDKMASAIIHICVANEINKKIKKDKSKLLIGSIAPDISKQVNETKKHSHFL